MAFGIVNEQAVIDNAINKANKSLQIFIDFHRPDIFFVTQYLTSKLLGGSYLSGPLNKAALVFLFNE
jgi:hypothetical protein